ncbi:hypothetical protein LTR27_010003 [Elasticomyces elasticus]|nr:hypothetical protein LTR27_010003 [Elasticomyces elasticus]
MAAPNSSPQPSAPPAEAQEPAAIVCAEDGDVILVLQNGKRLRVLAGVLSRVSPVFKTMLGPNFLEGQAPRSAEDPKELKLPDDSADAMNVLARFTHGLPSGPEAYDRWMMLPFSTLVLELGVLADKYDCTTAASMAAEVLMLRHVAHMKHDPSAIVSKTTVDAYGKLAVAAFMLRMDNFFAFFTRRLVLDAVASFGQLFETQEYGVLPSNITPSLEEQRTAVREVLVATVASQAHGMCQHCSRKSTGGTYATELARLLGLPHRPPPWSEHRTRNVLHGLYICKPVKLGYEYTCNHPNTSKLETFQLHKICHAASERAYGLCLTCARQNKLQLNCEHVSELKARSMNDPFIQA